MLKKVLFLNYKARYAYAPPMEDAVINTDEITSVTPTETRCWYPCVLIRFRNSDHMTVVGKPEDFAQ
jgi:hypothetical protein